MAQEPHQEAIFQDPHQDEGDGSQVLEEPEVRQEAQCEPQPAAPTRRQERRRKINDAAAFLVHSRVCVFI